MTPRQREILQMLVDGESLYWDGGLVAYIGNERTSIEMIYRLIRRAWIKQEGQSYKSPYWDITERGRDALADTQERLTNSE